MIKVMSRMKARVCPRTISRLNKEYLKRDADSSRCTAKVVHASGRARFALTVHGNGTCWRANMDHRHAPRDIDRPVDRLIPTPHSRTSSRRLFRACVVRLRIPGKPLWDLRSGCACACILRGDAEVIDERDSSFTCCNAA
ncbi:hypothetical protein [Solimonas terrae]|uniref:Uncharacterized protein n=1 Tax=Solimonas terrae TaxID=1396819 RepID=A0A6M2BMT8_9GAMM|nr:hypothetical protein [Solimonas terrae]NGY03407.1 hypothetical protein [Solimonas terrae]